MRKLVILCALALAACGRADIQDGDTPQGACEEFTRSMQDSPSTFRVIDVSKWEEPLTGEEMEEARRRQPLVGNGTPGVMIVGIEFDVTNAMGAVVRGANVCPFTTENGDVVHQEIHDLYKAAEEIRALRNQSATGRDFPKMQAPVDHS